MSQIENALPINADDPGLTAFALGELEGTDAARYAAAVAASVELQRVVAAIQAEAQILSNELRLEPTVTMTPERRAEILARTEACQPAIGPEARKFLGLTRRTAAVAAASVLLVPGAWFAIKTVFPRVHRSDVAASSFDPLKRGVSHAYNPAAAASRPELFEVSDLEMVSEAPPATSDTSLHSARVILHQKEAEIQNVELGQEASSAVTAGRAAQPADESQLGARYATIELETRMKTSSSSVRDSRRYGEADGVDHNRPVGNNGKLRPTGHPAEATETSPTQLSSVTRKNPVGLGPARTAPGQTGSPNDGKSDASGQKGGAVSVSGDRVERGLSLAEEVAREASTRTPQPALPTAAKPTAATPAPVAGPAVVHNPVPVGDSDPASKDKTVALLKKSPDRVPQKMEQREGRYAADLDKDDLQTALVTPARPEKEIALLEIERIKQKTLNDLTHEDVKRLYRARQQLGWQRDPVTNEAYNPIYENNFVSPVQEQLSTFSIDVDTASYSNLRRFLQSGQLPPPDAVRIEELVNYFAYQYPQPDDGRPFSVQTDIAACPWQPGHQLVRIGLKGKEIPKEQRPATNLVFLVDVSGSMSPENKLPLVRESLKTLVHQLDERDKIAIVTYAGEAGVALPSTSVAQRDTIIAAINKLGAGGSTNGAAGINTAYDIAAQEFIDKGTNRVILCTDGDFNVGVTSRDALEQMIQTRAQGGVFLNIFGFGMGNLKDATLEQLADKGNGQYGYIDDRQEADKVFIQEMMGTLVTIAKDVKIQIDFNKETVASYRLVGYENRVMAAEDFHNDKKDAGEIGAGHTVTALYEIIPTQDLKIDDKTRWLTVKLRYKQPEASESVLFENPLTGPAGQLKLASSDFQFASSVAACGMLLRHSQHAGQANWGLVKELAQAGLSHDPHGHRRGFLSLVDQAESLMGQLHPASPPPLDSTVRGKYKSLLRRLNMPEDTEKYGQFSDYGFSDTKSYGGSENLPKGYWVYAAPYWYIWAESTEPDERMKK